jgi:rhodanese-related sulfurtransferase
MRSMLMIPALVLALTSAFAGQGGDSANSTTGAQRATVHVLTRAELDKLLAKPSEILVIDVRRPDEVSKIGGLPIYLSVQVDDLERSVAWIPRGRSIITVSNHAKRASTAAEYLATKGFKVAGAVGAQEYERDGGTLTKIAVPPAQAATSTP